MLEEMNTAAEKPSDAKNELTPEKAASIIEHLRKEAEKYRKQNAQLRSELEPLQKRASEFEAAQKAALEEQGKYKELYEKAQAEIAKKAELETRLAAFEASIGEELDALKKLMTSDEVAAIDALQVPIEQRLKIARTIAGKRNAEAQASEARAGNAVAGASEALVAEFKKRETPTVRKIEILAEIERTNPTLYKRLIMA